jgi:hypothetical protein
MGRIEALWRGLAGAPLNAVLKRTRGVGARDVGVGGAVRGRSMRLIRQQKEARSRRVSRERVFASKSGHRVPCP